MLSRSTAKTVTLALWLLGCADETSGPAVCDAPPEAENRRFVDRSDELGVTFTHHMQSDLCHITDTIGGPGACIFDFDGDGDVDVFIPDREGEQSALYRNDGDRFENVSAELGVDQPGDGVGCLAFDYDGDDDIDLFVTTIGTDQLYRNDGGSFENVTDDVGIGLEEGFSTSATAGDIDGDGDLDLFVGRVVKLETCPDECYLFPINCEAETSLLYVNEGGTFVEESAARGISAAEPTLAALFFDQDADGDIDLYVGNDMGLAFEDRMYINDGSGVFTDEAESRGYAAAGTDTMGVDIGNVDTDDAIEMVTSDFKERPTRIYNCLDPALPCSFEALPSESAQWVRWAIGLEDFDGDGDLDLFQSSGDVYDPERLGSANQLFDNDGQGHFSFVEPSADDGLAKLAIYRGAAFADLDGDLDVDVVVTVNGGTPQFLYNVGASGHSMLVDAGPRAVGARIKVRAGGRSLTEQVVLGGSYLSTSDHRVHFGLGEACEAEVEVTYLDGRVETALGHPGEVVVVR